MGTGRNNLSCIVRRNKQGLSNKRGRHLAVTHTIMGSPRVLVLSSDTSTLSFTASTHLETTLHGLRKGGAVFVISREASSVRFTSRVLIVSSKRTIKLKARRRLLRGYRVCHRVCRSRFGGRSLKGGKNTKGIWTRRRSQASYGAGGDSTLSRALCARASSIYYTNGNSDNASAMFSSSSQANS